jgi:hypothetical protein
MHLLEDVANWDDVDPLSLEPVRDLARPWSLRRRGKRYFYDPWMWLELACRQQVDFGRVTHPVWRTLVHPVDLEALRDTCKACGTATTEEAKLLRQCDSIAVKVDKFFASDGDLAAVHIYCRSPLLLVSIVDHEYGSDGLRAGAPVKCRAVVCYAVADARGRVICRQKTYMGAVRT